MGLHFVRSAKLELVVLRVLATLLAVLPFRKHNHHWQCQSGGAVAVSAGCCLASMCTALLGVDVVSFVGIQMS